MLAAYNFSRQDIKCSIANLFFQNCIFFVVLWPLQSDKSGFVLIPWRKHFWSLSNNLILI